MKARGNSAPSISFSVEPIPKKPDKCLVRFYANPTEFTETRNGVEITGAEWDEFHLEMPNNGAVEAMVESNYHGYLAMAVEAESPAPTQLDRVEAQTMFTALMTDTLLDEEE